MVEGTGLENRHTGNGIVSSNLTLSVLTSDGSWQQVEGSWVGSG